MARNLPLGFGLGLLLFASAEAGAADLFDADPRTLLRTDMASVEAFTGYLTGEGHEYVFAGTSAAKTKLSQLDWSLGDSFAVGGRVAVRPLDWLTLRARGWATVDGDGSMTDRDWLAGYYGPNSWTHRSISPDTNVAKAWQADGSAVFRFWADEDTSLSAVVGFRHLETKWNASGGTYLYSVNALRDTAGTLPAQIGVAYHQWWDTPYLGLAASATIDDWTATVEGIGSPFVMAHDKDYHALRTLLFKEKFADSGMLGVSAALEYRLTPMLSLAGRVEYQKYFQTTGSTRVADGSTGVVGFERKPSGGAELDTLMVSLGIKARL